MIDIHVSLALNLLDGFSGRPLKPAQVRLFLDEEPCRPVYKEGGWFVLVNLAAGEHALRVEGEGFQAEERRVQGGQAYEEMALRLLPAPSYRFGRRVTTLTLCLADRDGRPLPGRRLYALEGERRALRLAQDDAQPGALQLRLFSAEKPARLPVPGLFFLEDGEGSELVELRLAQGMAFQLQAPLARAHRRGCLLRPARACAADEKGELFLVAEEEGPLGLLLEEAGGFHREELELRPKEHNERQLLCEGN